MRKGVKVGLNIPEAEYLKIEEKARALGTIPGRFCMLAGLMASDLDVELTSSEETGKPVRLALASKKGK